MASPVSIPRSLLLLPPPPTPASYRHLQTAYGPTLLDALQAVVKISRDLGRSAILEITLPCQDLRKNSQAPRSFVYSGIQSLLAGVYKLLSVICARESIETEGPGGVDARVLLISEAVNEAASDESGSAFTSCGLGVTLTTLALSERQWQTVFSVGSERGELMLQRFRDIYSTTQLPQWHNEKVRAGQYPTTDADQLGGTAYFIRDPNQRQRHFSVAVGGTFDHLHVGHKLLLTMTALVLEPPGKSDDRIRNLIVGISGDDLLQKKRFAEYMCSWEERATAVADFVEAIMYFIPPGQNAQRVTRSANLDAGTKEILTQIGTSFRLICVEIMDPYGPTITDKSISALVVSAETRSGGADVNKKRREKDWQELEIFEVDVLDAQDEEGDADEKLEKDFASKISSTEIRRRISEKEKGVESA